MSIFFTTATFPHQVRLQQPEDARIKLISFATVALLIWRTLILGSRILTFILFALLFRYWLFVVIGFHYLLMFALVFYQMRIIENTLKPIEKIVYNVVTPFIYIFDFCVNWLDGPSRYWYLVLHTDILWKFNNELLWAMVCQHYAKPRMVHSTRLCVCFSDVSSWDTCAVCLLSLLASTLPYPTSDIRRQWVNTSNRDRVSPANDVVWISYWSQRCK